jgi:peptidyl-prolyl cis-trans isomerase SurA
MIGLAGALLATSARAGEPVARLRARHVVVAWRGACRAPLEVTRTKDDARRRAQDVLARAKAGEPLDDLARRFTDEPGGAARGGDLGELPWGSLVPELENALAEVDGRALVPELVESPFGFHVMQRLDSRTLPTVRQVLVSWQGAPRAPAALRRTKDEARALAVRVSAEARAGVAFEALVQASSDDALKERGGVLGELRPGSTVQAFEQAARALAPGAISDPVETPFGFHVLQRLPEWPSGAKPAER